MARGKEKSKDAGPDPNGWMVTFGDLIMLLLTFFVLLLTMASMDNKAVKDIVSIMMGKSGPLETVDQKDIRTLMDLSPEMVLAMEMSLDDGNDLKSLLFQSKPPEVREILQRYGRDFRIINDLRGVVISFKTSILFESGKVDIKPETLAILKRLGEIIGSVTNDIFIIGHADNIPVRGGRYRSNWELSFFRALSMLDYFLKQGGLPPERFRVGGAGDSQPRHSNTTAASREKNRRVEIIFINRSLSENPATSQ